VQYRNHPSISPVPSRSRSWRPLLAMIALGAGMTACTLRPDAGESSAALSTTGRVTQLCSFDPNGNPVGGYVGPSRPPCEGTCYSNVSDGSCTDPPDGGSHLEIYGCAFPTNGQACDGNTGGVLLERREGGAQASFSSLASNPAYNQYCTFQIDVMRPGDPLGDANGNRDFIIWQRDDCGSPPPYCERNAECRDVRKCAPDGQCTANANVNDGSGSTCEFSLSQSPSSPYGLGVTDVTLTVTDAQGSDSCHATVQVDDCEPPTIVCPAAVVAECQGNGSAVVDPGDATATDLCTAVTVTDPGPGTYPLGTTEVEYTATDEYGNAASCTGTVTVEDTTPPVITVGTEPELWAPNHEYHTVTLADCNVVVIDGCVGELPLETGEITCVSSDEPDDVPTGAGDGRTYDDIRNITAQSVELRAERVQPGNGRVYTIHFQFTDPSGNVATGECLVGVPPNASPGAVAVRDEPPAQTECRSGF
jgi:hypothetical protein